MDQAAWDERYAGPELVWGAGPNCFVAAELTGLSPGRALDLGTGEGRNAIWLARARLAGHRGGLRRPWAWAAPPSWPGKRGVGVEWVQADLLSYDAGPGRIRPGAHRLHPASAARDLARLVRAAATAVAPGGTLLIQVISGTTREGRFSEKVARG